MPSPDGETLSATASALSDLVSEVRALIDLNGPDVIPPRQRGPGGVYYMRGGRFRYLPDSVFDRIRTIERTLPWPASIRDHSSSNQRRRLLVQLVEYAIDDDGEGVPEALAKIVADYQSRHRLHVFVFPVDNLQIRHGVEIRLGSTTLRAIGSDLWERFTEEVVTGTLARSPNDGRQGARIANGLLGESTLRAALKADGLTEGCIVAEAEGLPQFAYEVARENARFMLAALAAFNGEWDLKAGCFIALDGEQVQRANGRRFRFASGPVGASSFSDGVGPGLAFTVDAANTETEAFYRDLDECIRQATTPESLASRVVRTVYWLGHALNQPAPGEDADDEITLSSPARTLRPTRLEVGVRLRDLVTAVECSFKRDQSDRTRNVLARFQRAAVAAAPEWASKWPTIERAYDLRHAWTHEGVGDADRRAAAMLAGALQSVLPLLARGIARGTFATFEDLDGARDGVWAGLAHP